MKAIKRNLYDHTGVPGPHPIMWCPRCDNEASANKADYFYLPDSHKFKCACGTVMELVDKTLNHHPWKKPLDIPCGNCSRPATRTISGINRCERCAEL